MGAPGMAEMSVEEVQALIAKAEQADALAQRLAALNRPQPAEKSVPELRHEAAQIAEQAEAYYGRLKQALRAEAEAELAREAATLNWLYFSDREHGQFEDRLKRLSGKAGFSMAVYAKQLATPEERAAYEAKQAEYAAKKAQRGRAR